MATWAVYICSIHAPGGPLPPKPSSSPNQITAVANSSECALGSSLCYILYLVFVILVVLLASKVGARSPGQACFVGRELSGTGSYHGFFCVRVLLCFCSAATFLTRCCLPAVFTALLLSHAAYNHCRGNGEPVQSTGAGACTGSCPAAPPWEHISMFAHLLILQHSHDEHECSPNHLMHTNHAGYG